MWHIDFEILQENSTLLDDSIIIWFVIFIMTLTVLFKPLSLG